MENNEAFACYIGRPCYQKNTTFLLDVIKRVKDAGCTLKFVLLGVGYHSPELEEVLHKITDYGLSDWIHLKSWISHDECMQIVKQSEFYLTTSLYEGLPLSVIEAMSLGKVIVASDVVGNKDCVRNGENGFLLPLDVDIFAKKIIELHNNPKLREEMGKLSRQLFLDEFEITKQIGKLQEIYESGISK